MHKPVGLFRKGTEGGRCCPQGPTCDSQHGVVGGVVNRDILSARKAPQTVA